MPLFWANDNRADSDWMDLREPAWTADAACRALCVAVDGWPVGDSERFQYEQQSYRIAM